MTRDRHQLLLGRLDVLKAYGFPIIMVDGSSRPSDELQEAVEALGNVQYVPMPVSSFIDRALKGMDRCGTDFVVPLSDDDTFSPACIADCADFLASNGDYVAAQGSHWIKVYRRLWKRPQVVLEEYAPSLSAESPAARLLHHGAQYAHTYYAVHRGKTFIQSIVNCQPLSDDSVCFELSQSFAVVGLGKVKRFVRPYSIRSSNSTEEWSRKFRFHPRIWAQADPEEFEETIAKFIGIIERMSPFADMETINGRTVISIAIERYIAGELNPRGTLHRRYRYLMRLLNATKMDIDAPRVIETLSRSRVAAGLMSAANRMLLELGAGAPARRMA